MGSPLPILGTLIFFLLIVGGVLVVLVLVFGRRSKVTTPSCGQCGYAVAGLEVLRCPECGSDLRQVGIITERMQKGLHPLTRAALLAVGWTMLLPIPAMLISNAVLNALPRTMTRTVTAVLTSPDSQQYNQVTIDVVGRARTTNSMSIPYQTATVTLTTDAGVARPQFDLQPFDAESAAADLLDWMSRLNLDPADPALIAEANDLAAQLQGFSTGNNAVNVSTFASVGVSSGMNYENISTWYPLSAAAFWFVIWLLPIVWIIRRGITRHRADRAATA